MDLLLEKKLIIILQFSKINFYNVEFNFVIEITAGDYLMQEKSQPMKNKNQLIFIKINFRTLELCQ